MLGAGYLLAQDVVVSAAAAQPDPHAAAAVVSAYENNAVVTGITVVYLAGHVIGFIMLGIALVVFVFTAVLMMANGVQKTLR